MNELAEQIYIGLTKQSFADWYNSQEFDAHISGDEGAKTKEEILKDIQRIFRLPSDE